MQTLRLEFGEDRGAHTASEEIVHALTHGLGAILASIALVFLVLKVAGLDDLTSTISVTIYAACVVLLYVSSTLYHGGYQSPHQPLFKLFDQSAIYFKIAGTYTPFAIITLQTTMALWVLIGIWGAALVGTAIRCTDFARDTGKANWLLSLFIYLAMGWSGVFVILQLYEQSPGGFAWVVAGGLCFTFGTIFYAIHNIRFMHAIWHVFVLAGSACHFVAVYFYVI